MKHALWELAHALRDHKGECASWVFEEAAEALDILQAIERDHPAQVGYYRQRLQEQTK